MFNEIQLLWMSKKNFLFLGSAVLERVSFIQFEAFAAAIETRIVMLQVGVEAWKLPARQTEIIEIILKGREDRSRAIFYFSFPSDPHFQGGDFILVEFQRPDAVVVHHIELFVDAQDGHFMAGVANGEQEALFLVATRDQGVKEQFCDLSVALAVDEATSIRKLLQWWWAAEKELFASVIVLQLLGAGTPVRTARVNVVCGHIGFDKFRHVFVLDPYSEKENT